MQMQPLGLLFSTEGRFEKHVHFLIVTINMQIQLGPLSVSSGMPATLDWQH